MAFFAKVRGGVTHVTRRKDDALYAQGDAADSVFYIESGKAKVTVVSAQGKEAVVAVLGSGQFAGEGCLAGQAVRMASVTAMTDCAATRIEKDAMIRLIHEQPEVLHYS